MEKAPRVLALLVLCCAMLLAVSARATDQPVAGTKLVLRKSGTKQKLTFVSKDPAVLFPAIGGPDDPAGGSPGGAMIEIFSSVEPGGASSSAPPVVGNPGWTVRDARVDSYQFRNSHAPTTFSPIRKIVLKHRKTLRVVAAATGLSLSTPQTSVGIRVRTGGLRSCARFDPPTVVRDEPGRFVARDSRAAALADCSDASLAGPTATTTSVVTTTTAVSGTTIPVCGDGVKNQSSEACDGTANLIVQCGAGYPTAGCFEPGTPDECTCCTNGPYCDNSFFPIVPCCDPEAFCMVMGPPSHGATVCWDPTCGPGDDCVPGQACVDGQCCIDGPGTCYFDLSQDFIPCCPPNVCTPVTNGGFCLPPP